MTQSKETLEKEMKVVEISSPQSGMVYIAISKALGLKHTTVRVIVSKWRKFETEVNFPESHQPAKMHPRDQFIRESQKRLNKHLRALLTSDSVI